MAHCAFQLATFNTEIWLTRSQTTSTSLGCVIVTLHPQFISRQFRLWRASFYAGFGLSSILFVVHGVVLHGWDIQKTRMSLSWMAWMATSNLVGAAIYAARVCQHAFVLPMFIMVLTLYRFQNDGLLTNSTCSAPAISCCTLWSWLPLPYTIGVYLKRLPIFGQTPTPVLGRSQSLALRPTSCERKRHLC